MRSKVYIQWKDVKGRLSIIDTVGKKVYGIPTGGMICSGLLKHAEQVLFPHQADIIIDDLWDSGETMTKYMQEYPDKEYFCLFDKRVDVDIQGKWLVFPWEVQPITADDETVHQNIVRILQYIGEDVTREGLVGTPDRVIRMYEEIFRGYNPSKRPRIATFHNGADGLVYDQMVTDEGTFYSHCEHHMVPFFGTYYFAYIPSKKGNIIGLSKVARIVDYYAAKLQIQERLVNDIVEDLWNALCEEAEEPPLGMALLMKGEHLCKTMRGAKKKGCMTTTKLKGCFLENAGVKSEFLNQIK
jgi:GTP cyclohydrolase IA